MKKLSIQTRLVLFHTAAMTLVVALVLGLLFSLSSQEILTSAQATLEERVSQGVEEVEYTQGRLEFDSELLSLENGVYLSVYQPGDSSMLYGRLPYGFAYTLPLSDGELRTVTAGGTDYSVLDLQFPVEGYGTLVMRGVVSLTAAERDFRATLRLALVLLPLLVALTALCGYLFSRRALRPVAQITQTVQNIQQERDLSKRVRLGEGRDEIYTLAQTFDSLLDQVEASFRREKQFTSDVAHELRTPLSVALMQCEELLAREDTPPEARQQVEVIRRKVDSMAGMVSQLLLLSRADQGREKLALEELDLSELSELVAQEFAELAGEKGIALEMCPTSNRQTHAILDRKQYPLVRFLESGIRVTVNTDDMGIERTCLSKEFDYLKREFGLTEEQQKQVVLNAADAAFASEETKKMLREKILKVYGASL